MKVSLEWIKDYVALPDDMDLKRLAYDLTMSTVEVEDIHDLAKSFDNILVGVITEVLPHPNADKLRICKVDLGAEGIQEIVCGGINLAAGMKVAAAIPGAMVRWHGEGEPVEIKKAKLRGVPSYGMICASDEIGLGDLFPSEQEAQILDLSFLNVAAGTPVADALDLHDIILEIDNKSMTNRPDLWGHYGIAREIAALYDLPLAKIDPYVPDAALKVLPVQVEDTVRCPRYIGVEIDGLSVKPATFKMQSRIWRVGMRPINALVDITNYVMLTTGQPTHAFDSNNIHDHLVIRRAQEGEQLALLNGKELTLSTDDLVIADVQNPVGLAGIMGGSKDSVLPETRKVILEIANFQGSGVRRTALRYDNRTEASARYEKAIDPERCELALALSMKLFRELYPEMTVCAYSDTYPNPLQCTGIDVPLSWLESRLGLQVPNDYIANKLGRMGFTVSFTDDMLHVVPPTWRSTGDISMKADIMEEVARMYGYENFQATPITTSFTGAINQLEVDIDRKTREYLAFRCGMQEIFTYPWMEDKFINAVLKSTENMFCLSAPPSPTERFIRSSLLPNLCAAVEKNQHYFTDFAIFEGAQVVSDKDYVCQYFDNEQLPVQRRHLAGAFVDANTKVLELFKKAKGVLEDMPRYTHMEPFTFKRVEQPVWAESAVWLNLFVGDVMVGSMGMLSARATMDCGIKEKAVMLFELDVDLLKPFSSRTNTFTHLPEYPMNDYDVSMLFDVNTTWEQIQSVVQGCKGKTNLLQGISFVDEYRGKNIPEGKKSVTFRLTIGAADRTLKLEEINACAATVSNSLKKRLGADMRF